MTNLSNKDERENLEQTILREIDEWCVNKYSEGHRKHLGASIIGDPCSRRLWYTFRWVRRETFSGRMHRLFQVGHNAEPRFIEYLKGIGFVIFDKTEDGKQFRISGCEGHYGGSLDSWGYLPERYNYKNKVLFEFKTNNTGSGFVNVGKNGVPKEKPKHYAQMCQYGFKHQIEYCVYVIENKNDSDLIIKIVPLDWNYGAALEKKAEDIILSNFPPAKISEQPSYFECKFCDFSKICHENEPVEINCRSCKLSSPIANKEWFCNRFNSVIPQEYIEKGCEYHLSVNS
jgi:hypothetical protein